MKQIKGGCPLSSTTPARLCRIIGLSLGLLVCSASSVIAAGPAAVQRQLDEAVTLAHNGKRGQAEGMLRDLLRNNPNEDRAYAALLQLASARELPALSRAFDFAKRRLSSKFNSIQTDRFVLLSDVPADQSRENAFWAERTYEEFHRFATECGLRPLPLEHKLVCVLFERRSEYQSFAQEHDGMTNVSFTGYYSPRNDRVVFSLEPDHPQASAPRAAQKSDEVKPVLGFDSHSATEQHDHVDHDDDGAMAAKCVHETIHQLMFHTRVMSPEIQYPLWICEGLSTAFETSSPDDRFGPDCDFAPRREAFEDLLVLDDLISLRELVTLTNLNGASQRTTRAVYQQSYALVTWLYRERKEQLRDYLNTMRREPAGRLASRRHLQLFEQAFGDVEQVERDWLSFERSGQRAAQTNAN